jgi:hypothetical protein
VLRKPFDLQDLLDAIGSVLGPSPVRRTERMDDDHFSPPFLPCGGPHHRTLSLLLTDGAFPSPEECRICPVSCREEVNSGCN